MDNGIRNSDERLITLSVEDVANVLGVSRATAYNLANSKGFPILRIGKRMVVPKAAFIKWIEKNTNNELQTKVKAV